jgi:hypothetical protein
MSPYVFAGATTSHTQSHHTTTEQQQTTNACLCDVAAEDCLVVTATVSILIAAKGRSIHIFFLSLFSF